MKAFAGPDARKRISDTALGKIAPDIVITNACLFNAFTREFCDRQSIWIKDNMIAYAGPDHDPDAIQTRSSLMQMEWWFYPAWWKATRIS
jgi:adenine deaminase